MKSSRTSADEKSPDSRSAYVMLVAMACLYGVIALSSRGLGYGGDSFSHYTIARYSWKHPELLLDAWGKPFFTLVSSPFAQLGWPAMVTFNVLCAVMTSFVVYRYCRTIGIPHSWLSIVLLGTMPIYLRHVPTGFLEPFFTLLMASSAYLFLTGHLVAACLLVSFLPLVRTEGIAILILFLAALWVVRRVVDAPLLGAGLVLYSVIGYIVKGNLFWLKSEGYSYDSLKYGLKGTVWYYFRLAPSLYGVPLLPLLLFGLGWLGFWLARNRIRDERHSALVVTGLLMTGSLCALFAVYVVTWAFGIFDVIGLTRPVATTAPGAVVTAMLAVRWASERLETKRMKNVLLALLCALAVASAYRLAGIGSGLSKEDAMTKEAVLWLKNSEYAKQKIYYMNPIVSVELDVDPFDAERVGHLRTVRRGSLRKGAIIFWDAHFGPNEARLPLGNLMKSPDLVLLKSYVSDPPFITFNGYRFEIHIFQKRSDTEPALYVQDGPS